ncbi:conserved hypothetical protein [Ricinus communis]|uniref:Uncharacterized protein n=1 Tax=Ricinus communis TaxID=3988 RepID=B9T5G3_RICCO|nr:conserved hypothetical protein [Ricinus communis]
MVRRGREERRNIEKLREERARRNYGEENRWIVEQGELAKLIRYEEAVKKEREEEEQHTSPLLTITSFDAINHHFLHPNSSLDLKSLTHT